MSANRQRWYFFWCTEHLSCFSLEQEVLDIFLWSRDRRDFVKYVPMPGFVVPGKTNLKATGFLEKCERLTKLWEGLFVKWAPWSFRGSFKCGKTWLGFTKHQHELTSIKVTRIHIFSCDSAISSTLNVYINYIYLAKHIQTHPVIVINAYHTNRQSCAKQLKKPHRSRLNVFDSHNLSWSFIWNLF